MTAQRTKQNQHTSLVARLNARLFLRLLGIYLTTDLLLCLLCMGGLFLHAEYRGAELAAMVDELGVPSAETTRWMAAGDSTVSALDREPRGIGTEWLGLLPAETRAGLRSLDGRGGVLFFFFWEESDGNAAYVIELAGEAGNYAISVDLSAPVRMMSVGMQLIFLCQILSLISNLFKNAGTIRKVLRPIQELADAAQRLGSASAMSGEELNKLASRLGEIDDADPDARLPVDGTQKELKVLSQAINAMLDRINQSYRAQMRFVSDASHELRTPISVIQGYASLLDRWGKDDPATRQEAIDAILQETRSMKELVEDMLFLARGDNDSLAVTPEVFDLTGVAAQIIRDSQVVDQTHPMEVKWEEPVYVNCDVGLVRQAVRVLVDNAIKYTPAGGAVRVEVTRREGMAALSVSDEGIGIAEEALPHIFDRFYRADESRTRQTGGTGLGLPIAKWIVERHKGWIEVVSRPGAGTRMTILLPAVDGEETK